MKPSIRNRLILIDEQKCNVNGQNQRHIPENLRKTREKGTWCLRREAQQQTSTSKEWSFGIGEFGEMIG